MPGVVIGGADQPPFQVSNPTPMGGGSGKKKSWLLPGVIAVVLILLLGGGYVFAFYLPNRPSAVFNTSLKRSGEAIDSLISYANNSSKKNYKSVALSGNVSYAGSLSFNASLNGGADSSGDAKLTANVDVLGNKLNANIDTVHVAGSSVPDVYLQANGIKALLDSEGLSELDGLDGKWLSIDHTLISSAASSVNQNASSVTQVATMPTAAEVTDAATKAQAVNKKYLFTSDPKYAVFTDQKYVGKETKSGRSVYHYKVSYNKTNFESYLSQLGNALDSSSLNTWSKTANDGKSLSQVMNLSSTESSLGAKGSNSSTLDLWVDAKTKLPQTIQFADPSDKTNVLTLSQGYTGGVDYPFTLEATGTSSDGQAQDGTITFTINSSTNKVTAGLTLKQNGSTLINASLAMTPSEQNIQVTPPANAEPLSSLMNSLGLGSNSTTGL